MKESRQKWRNVKLSFLYQTIAFSFESDALQLFSQNKPGQNIVKVWKSILMKYSRYLIVMLRISFNAALLNVTYSKYFIQIDILENGVGSNIRLLMCFYKCWYFCLNRHNSLSIYCKLRKNFGKSAKCLMMSLIFRIVFNIWDIKSFSSTISEVVQMFWSKEKLLRIELKRHQVWMKTFLICQKSRINKWK